jgi:hypothetical protein
VVKVIIMLRSNRKMRFATDCTDDVEGRAEQPFEVAVRG